MTTRNAPAGLAAFGLALLGLAGASATPPATPTAPYRAVCRENSCGWVGIPRLHLHDAALDARGHWTRTGHPVWVEGLPLTSPFPCGQTIAGPRE